jgi:hypothetical protein
VIGTNTLLSVGLQRGLRSSLIMALSSRVTHGVVDVEFDVIACGFCGWRIVTLPVDDLIRSKQVVEQRAIIHVNVCYHRSTNTARSCTPQDCP